MSHLNPDIEFSEAFWQRDAYAREAAETRWEALQMADWEPELERSRRRSPIDEPCCQHSGNFTCIPSIERDPDTGYFEGNSYRCDNCGTRICEEDYAALMEWNERQGRLMREMIEWPVPNEPWPVVFPGKVA